MTEITMIEIIMRNTTAYILITTFSVVISFVLHFIFTF